MNIITVEDPVEYRLDGVNQMQINPKAGLTFVEARPALPNAIVLPGLAVVLALLAMTGEWATLLRAVIAAAALFAFYLAIALIVPRGMGMGDVKLAALVGLALGWIGWGALVVGAFAAFVFGAFGGLLVVALRGGSRKTAIPFGPWMLLGMALGLVAGTAISGSYLGMLGF